MSSPPRVSVIGSLVSVCDGPGALDAIEQGLRSGEGGYICFTSAHGVVMGRQDRAFQAVTNDSLLSVADGKPVYWIGRLKGAPLGHLPGPDFMPRALQHFAKRRHFFYGSTPEVLDALVEFMSARIPGLNVCGTLSPPFRKLTPAEVEENFQRIRDSGAELIWVGLGAPKQEFWMAEAWLSLRPAVLLGVGAAFDFNAGKLQRAPVFWRRLGLEWFYRFSREPRRLWKRYLVTITLFMYYSLQDSFTTRPDEPDRPSHR